MAAAVDGEVGAGDEAGGVRRQEGDTLGHLVHLAWSAQRVGLLALGKKLKGGGRGGGLVVIKSFKIKSTSLLFGQWEPF